MERAARIFLNLSSGPQSALDPAGREAERIATLFWWMAAGAVLVWLAVIALAVYAAHRPGTQADRAERFFVLVCGVALPTAILTTLLVYGLTPIPDLLEPAPDGSLEIQVSGEQWWWRIRYKVPGGPPVELANEIHLPVGEPVQFWLDTPDVIHSFWIPSLGGKVDMIPGRVTRLKLTPVETGHFHGVCAEYCGASHALMGFRVVVEQKAQFEQWLARQAEASAPLDSSSVATGAGLFIANGCGACHTVRGTAADGVIGPDLTHVGSRLSLAAGVLPNDVSSYERWISSSFRIKSGSLMPSFHMLPSGDVPAMAAYLEALQ